MTAARVIKVQALPDHEITVPHLILTISRPFYYSSTSTDTRTVVRQLVSTMMMMMTKMKKIVMVMMMMVVMMMTVRSVKVVISVKDCLNSPDHHHEKHPC